MYFGGGVLPQASTVDGIRVKDNFGNMTGTSKTLWSKTDMSNLRLINETSASSVSSIYNRYI